MAVIATYRFDRRGQKMESNTWNYELYWSGARDYGRIRFGVRKPSDALNQNIDWIFGR